MADRRAIPLTRPFLGEEEAAAAAAALASGFVVQGPQVRRFEELVAQQVGVAHALAVTSATAGLHLALWALDLEPGDEVLVPAFTFPATGNVVTLTGATPVLVDVSPEDYALDLDDVAAKIGPRTRAVMPVDPFGLPYDAVGLAPLAERHDLVVIEDAACALGAAVGDRAAGSLGEIGVFSFHGRKIITTGEGGMVVTDDDEIAARIERLRNHGIVRGSAGFSFVEPAGNQRMSDIAGAIGVAQMGKLERIVALRRRWAARLSALLEPVAGVTPQATPAGRTHTHQSYVVRLDAALDRAAVIADLRQRGVESTIGTYALHLEPVFARLGVAPDDLPGARLLGEHSLTLPLYPGMEEGDVERVAAAVAETIATVGR